MMNGTHFYLTLPSNASMTTFPDNTPTSHRVKLPQAVDLNGNWEVGLYSITYPHTWYNVQRYDCHVYYSEPGSYFETSIVDYGYCDTMNDFIDASNKSLLKDTKGNVSLTFNQPTKKVSIHLKNGYRFAIAGKWQSY